MANKSKIFGELEVRVREMCEKGYNATHIGKQVGLAKDTINLWAKKNGYDLPKRQNDRLADLEPEVVRMLKEGRIRKQIQKELDVHYEYVTRIAEKYKLTETLRDRSEASLDKILTREEVEAKIPDESKYLYYDEENKLYIFLCTRTNKQFDKNVGKIRQGSPYGKSGTRITEEEFEERLMEVEHTLEKGTFTKTKAPVTVYCANGHKRELTRAFYAIQFNCPTCNRNGTSRPELEIMAWVKTYYPNAYKYKFPNNKTKRKEIDVYIPELKLGIEYCGLFSHSERLENENLSEEELGLEGKHYKKTLMAKDLGIRLITIFSDEWEERNVQIRNFLVSAMKMNEYRIFAKNCTVKEIDKKTGQEFLDKHHIQGADNSFAYFGLFFEENLVSVMSAGKHPQRHTLNDKAIYLNRLAFEPNLTVAGGASKLLSYFKKYAKDKGYAKIVSWSDNRWSDGKIYETLGFKYDSQSEKGRGLSDGSIWPDFWYVYRDKRITRSVAEQKGLKELDLDKIWDCGKKRWAMDL